MYKRQLPAFSSYIAKKLADYPDIHTGGVISFPGGGDTIFQKSRQAKELREAGCKELDMVMNLTALRSHEDNYVLEDIGAVREAAGKDILKAVSYTHLDVYKRQAPILAAIPIQIVDTSHLM